MKARDVLVVFRREALDVSRDRRAIFSAIVLPALLYPVLFLGLGRLERTGRARLAELPIAIGLAEGEGPQFLRAAFGEGSPAQPCEIVSGVFASGELATDKVHLLLLVRETPPGEAPEIEVRYDSSSELSREAWRRGRLALEAYRREGRRALFVSLGLSGDPGERLRIEVEDLATPERAGGASLGRILPFVLVLVILSGGSFAAIDAFAGERERGTLETLLVHPVGTAEIAAGKFGAVLLASLAAAFANVASLVATASLLGLPGSPDRLRLAPGGLAAALLVLLPTAVFLTALLVAVAARARSFREGQNYVFPLSLLASLPAIVSLLPGTKLDPLLACIPVAGPTLAFREAIRGSFELLPVALAAVTSALYAAVALGVVSRTLDAERILREQAPEAEAFAARAHARRALAALGVAMLAVYYVGGLAQTAAPLPGLAFTLFGLVLPAAFWVARAGGLSPTRAFPVGRSVGRRLALGVLLGPLAATLSLAVIALQSSVLPLPSSLERAFAESLDPTRIPAPLLFGLAALAPAFCEEMLFRGSLLRGLARDLGDRRAVLWSALLFAAFHFSIYRFAPTASLGLLLGWVATRERSLVPAMALHATHNALLLAFARAGELSPLTNPYFLASAALGLVLAPRLSPRRARRR